jgi:hypothetical protein
MLIPGVVALYACLIAPFCMNRIVSEKYAPNFRVQNSELYDLENLHKVLQTRNNVLKQISVW